jgi:hypothetical protein
MRYSSLNVADHTLVLSRLVVAVESHLSDDVRKRAVQCLVAATQVPAPVGRLSAILGTLDDLHATPTAEERGAILERMVRAMEKNNDAGSLAPVVKQMAPFISSLNADQARRLGERLLVAAQDPGTTVIAFDALLQLVKNFVARPGALRGHFAFAEYAAFDHTLRFDVPIASPARINSV